MVGGRKRIAVLAVAVGLAAAAGARPASADFRLGPETVVQVGGADLKVSGYSVPSLADWNGDGLDDLIVGEGGSGFPGKVRVYLNEGAPGLPQFSTFSYVQAGASALVCPSEGCLGVAPRLVAWRTGFRDLLAGQANGTVRVFQDAGTSASPALGAGELLEVGLPGAEVVIDVGSRATPAVCDWNNDGATDFVLGGADGRFRLYLNAGTGAAPTFPAETILPAFGGGDLDVGSRSSPVVFDFTGDGLKDLLSGDTEGRIWLMANLGTDAAPVFGAPAQVEADGVPIDLPSYPRSRPSVADWNGDGLADLLVGAVDGNVHLYVGVPEPATLALLAVGLAGLGAARRRR